MRRLSLPTAPGGVEGTPVPNATAQQIQGAEGVSATINRGERWNSAADYHTAAGVAQPGEAGSALDPRDSMAVGAYSETSKAENTQKGGRIAKALRSLLG